VARARGAIGRATGLRRDGPKIKLNYAKAAFTLMRSMRSMPYADWLAHRNSVATKELASAVIAWVIAAPRCLWSVRSGERPHFLRDDRVWPPDHPHRKFLRRGPQRHCDGSNETTYDMREAGTELRERGTRAPSLALLARCQRSHQRRMDNASRSQSLRWRFVRLNLRDPETKPRFVRLSLRDPETEPLMRLGSIGRAQSVRDRLKEKG
jgi:hypothetical protein